MLFKSLRMLVYVLAVSLGTAIVNVPALADFELEATFPQLAKRLSGSTGDNVVREEIRNARRDPAYRQDVSLSPPETPYRPSLSSTRAARVAITMARKRNRVSRKPSNNIKPRPKRRVRTAALAASRERSSSISKRSASSWPSSNWPASKQRARSGSRGYSALIAKHARANGIPVALAHAIVRIESGYRAHVRGRAGEVGLMQIKPSTARAMGYRGSARGLYRPDTNLRWGMRYLGSAYRRAGGNLCGTVLRYNAGHYARRMNRISRRYCQKVRRLMGIGSRT